MPVIGILRRMPEEDIMPILKAYREAGFTTIEITIDTVNSERFIADAIKEFGETLNIGAGTVLDKKDLDTSIKAGAQFVVTPMVNEDLITECVKMDVPVFPGAYTPTEIFYAWKSGASMVKVFPAGEAGMDYIRALKGPLKDIRLLPTGGISINNANDYFRAGAEGLGVSTGLFKPDLIRKKDWEKLREHLLLFHQAIQSREPVS